MLRFELLGPVSVRSDRVGVPLGPPLRRTLLALLAWHRGSTVSVDRIVDALWEAEPPSRPEASIQAMMSHLRRAIEPDRGPRGHAEILRTQLPGYRLVLPAEARLDVDDFRRALSAARAARSTGDHASAAAAATHALQFWSGTPFAGALDVAFVRRRPIAWRTSGWRPSTSTPSQPVCRPTLSPIATMIGCRAARRTLPGNVPRR